MKSVLEIFVVILCGGGLLMLVPVTAAIVLDFAKGIKEVFRKG